MVWNVLNKKWSVPFLLTLHCLSLQRKPITSFIAAQLFFFFFTHALQRLSFIPHTHRNTQRHRCRLTHTFTHTPHPMFCFLKKKKIILYINTNLRDLQFLSILFKIKVGVLIWPHLCYPCLIHLYTWWTLCCSSNTLGMLLPQGLCICCSFCLEHSCPRYLYGSLSLLLWVFVQGST